MRKVASIILLLGLAFIGRSWAEEAHVHGHATLQIILGTDKLMISFTSPAANIVGFEHKPNGDQQRHQVKQAIARLQQGDSLFRFGAGQCTLASASVSSDLLPGDDEHHGHDENHGHSDFDAEYEFTCQAMDKMAYIDVQLFDAFPGIEEIDTYLLSDTSQRSLELNAQQHRIHLD